MVKHLWRFKCPSKACIFMWSVINNKALTRDDIHKRNKYSPVRCPLGKENDETTVDLIMICSCSLQIWKEVGVLIGIKTASGATLLMKV